ncbi:MAG TPA: glycoside hydrolase family 38 C-terminal domain-containing protein [Acidimicrobiales bacterium]|nr:glycoside hydrolase family 38 C-terminal domain-containing protein [Acidimicrobiales bacterium]
MGQAGRSADGTDAAGTARRIAVVPHTHWDREWYEPFQTFRLKLVRLVDGLLDQMEQDSSYRHFLLDGQLAVIDDYREIRPENEARLAALTGAGRITVGPWYILMDEFLVSGETIIRNLQAGMGRGTAFGGVMDVGYLPDMFGHVSQMPQILTLAGFEHAVVWRGVPSAVDRNAFRWSAPDGSSVRAEYLVAGYGNGAALPDDAKALVRRLQAHVEEFGAFLRPGDPLLLMNGTDHQPPQPWLGRVVDEANQIQSEFELTISSLPDYLASAPADGLPEWQGELRSGFRSNLLMGVGSNRVDVKQAAARAERALEHRAEPLSALFLPADAWPEAFLELAWTLMIRNAAHDSICACSVDDVVDAVLHRYAEARHLGQGVADQAVDTLARSMAEPGPVVVNPSAPDRGGQVEVVVPATGPVGPDIQVLSERIGLPGSITLDGQTVRTMVGLIQGARIGEDMYITDVSLAEDEAGLDITLVIGTEARDGVPVEEVKRELFTRLTARPDTEVRLRLDQPPVRRILARQREVPGFGWAHFEPAPLAHPVKVDDPADGPVTVANGLATVVVDPNDGTFAIDGIAGFGRLVDGGDYGDTYNYSPPQQDSVIERPDTVSIAVGDRGPVRATVAITSTFTWPDRVDEASKARVGSHRVPVVTTVEVRADESLVRVSTRFVNPQRDHRLRVHLPLPEPAATSQAECAFTVVERGLVAEGRDEEIGIPTFPSHRFVSSGGLTVVHEGLLEYELVDVAGDRAHTLALTLLRSTGMLSRLGMTLRPMPAGPMTPIEGPQLLGPVEVRYALALGDVDPYRMADELLEPLITAASFGGGDRAGRGSALTVRGAEVSAVRRQAGQVEVRVFNPRSTPASVTMAGRSGWLVDLRGRPVAAFEGGFELRPHGIATARLDGD